MAKYRSTTPELAVIFKALSDESRLRTFHVLSRGELCVCQITELLGLAPSTVSKHMSVLKQAGLVESRKDGRWIYYRPAHFPKGTVGGRLKGLILKELSDSEQGVGDMENINKILKCNPEELCKRQLQR